MLDYYSNFPPPLYEDALNIIKTKYLEKFNSYHKENTELINEKFKIIIMNNLKEWESECLMKSFIDSDVLDDDNKIKFSLTGWMVFGCSNVLEELVKKSKLFYAKYKN